MNILDEARFVSDIGVGILTVIGLTLGAFIVYNAILAIFRLCILEPSRACVLLVAESMGDALGGRCAPERELIGLQALLPWPHPQRLARAARELQGTTPSTLVTVLARHRLLPSLLVPFASAAERLGPAVLESWLRALAGSLYPRRPQTRRVIPTLLTLYIMFLVASFFMSRIGPLWEHVMLDCGIPNRALSDIVWLGRYMPAIAIALAILISIGCGAWSRWRWILERRIQKGEIISQALQLRLPEAEIASALGLHADVPSLAELCSSQGFQASTPDELALLLEQARQSHARRMLIAGTLFEVIAPLVLAVPVLFYGWLIFGSIVRIVSSFSSSP